MKTMTIDELRRLNPTQENPVILERINKNPEIEDTRTVIRVGWGNDSYVFTKYSGDFEEVYCHSDYDLKEFKSKEKTVEITEEQLRKAWDTANYNWSNKDDRLSAMLVKLGLK